MEYSKEFKAALSAFSNTEKDKLIFRLLKKDKLLSKKLYFELIDPETTDDKRNAMETLVEEKVILASKYIGNAKYFLTIIRKLSAEITEHIKITTDKFGEASLNLLLVNKILDYNNDLSKQRFDNVYKLYIYIINKVFRSLVLIKKLDEDYWMEFDDLLRETQEKILENHYLQKLCINNGLDFNWLESEKIPADIELIMKDIKSQGFLR
ncbi:deoxyuridine 5'-triphosphate nucleotidohydrolase [Chryseobacterium lactis]|uniref:Deoxyuridine 5'-triphosphate nucleotidohydrolase n=1 Tax=Chryseobacterium lactis TaxID=1241981 RepID=A0A3G6RLS6_CHRLC|nr:deoxyuridine 5'-triphosphate nucleotidohydrolase [Chryseobacterium lactis]AZA80911.1 deoxyuridine 5'-triphosphate nucleotidohydrolase [Chryseobacterium lactis]AZB05912.1 deoxyuridine 5'-triphosphate nucleotidohydrolase [Chryseobacterium lactis]PNW13368.1 deoxyuridine 5'-triphosphate nucleotidohydrolase [Chryseobacterium lactis]